VDFRPIHDDISLIWLVIPGLTKPAPYLIRGNPVIFWIPAFAGMTRVFVINGAGYKNSEARISHGVIDPVVLINF